jgi:RNA polymerase sigma-70 factor (ECF subfamily)
LPLPLSETQILAGLRAGDRRAQESLFKSYYSDFRKTCLRYATDDQEAESLLSDAFFKIFTKISSYNGTGNFEGWMRQIVVNTCLSAVRTRLGRRAVLVTMPEEDLFLDDGPKAAPDAVSKLSFDDLLRLIARLPAASRAVFNLYIFDGFSHREIAQELGISEGTSHWHLSTARRWLQAQLTETRHER